MSQNKQLTPKNDLANADGFAGYSDRVEGDDAIQDGRVIQGGLIKFTNEAEWISRDEGELPADLELVVIDVVRICQKWVDQVPVETRVLEPDEPFPDMDALNDAAPKTEWREDLNGKLVGPWQAQRVLYLLDPKTMTKYSLPTGTIGGGIAIRDVVDKVKWMRKFRGAGIYAVVTLSNVPMKTRYGARRRPRFNIVRWVKFDDDGGVLPAPAGGQVPSKTLPPSKDAAKPDKGAKTVGEPSLKEQMNDDLPF